MVARRYHRIEVLGALASVLSTWLVTGILLYEAVNRILDPSPVNGKGAGPPPALSPLRPPGCSLAPLTASRLSSQSILPLQ